MKKIVLIFCVFNVIVCSLKAMKPDDVRASVQDIIDSECPNEIDRTSFSNFLKSKECREFQQILYCDSMQDLEKASQIINSFFKKDSSISFNAMDYVLERVANEKYRVMGYKDVIFREFCNNDAVVYSNYLLCHWWVNAHYDLSHEVLEATYSCALFKSLPPPAQESLRTREKNTKNNDKELLPSEIKKYLLPGIPELTSEELLSIKDYIEGYKNKTLARYDLAGLCARLSIMYGVVNKTIIDAFVEAIFNKLMFSGSICRDASTIVNVITSIKTLSDDFKKDFINYFYTEIINVLSDMPDKGLFGALIKAAQENVENETGLYNHRLYFVIYASTILRYHAYGYSGLKTILRDIRKSKELDASVYKGLCDTLIDICQEQLLPALIIYKDRKKLSVNADHLMNQKKIKVINCLKRHPYVHFVATAAVGSAATLAWCIPYFYRNSSLTDPQIVAIGGAGALSCGLLYYLKEKLMPKSLFENRWSPGKELLALSVGTTCALGIGAGIKYLPKITEATKIFLNR